LIQAVEAFPENLDHRGIEFEGVNYKPTARLLQR